MAENRYHFNPQMYRPPIACTDFKIWQLGELYSNENTRFEPHRQPCDEISFIVSGAGRFYSEGVGYPVSAGDCFFSFRGKMHQIENDSAHPLRFVFCGFEPVSEMARGLLEELKNGPGPRLHCPAANPILKDMLEEIWQPRAHAAQLLGSLLTRLLITLIRENGAAPEPQEPHGFPSLTYQIIMFLDSHIRETDALGKLAHEFHYSYRSLSARFQSSMSQTLRAYFTAQRMEYARELLNSGMNVTETAEAMGYSSVHPFSRAYKNHFGVPPRPRP